MTTDYMLGFGPSVTVIPDELLNSFLDGWKLDYADAPVDHVALDHAAVDCALWRLLVKGESNG